MSRPARRRLLTIAAATAAVLAVPAAASAATYTVKAGDGACGGSDLACGGLAEAAAAAGAGDVFNVAAGAYPGATFTVGGVTINGAPGVVVTTTLEFAGGSGGVSKLSKVGIAITSGNGPGVNVSGASGLELSDAGIASANGHGVLISAGTANKVVRSLVASGGADTSAIRVESDAGSAAKSLTVDSTIVVGGSSGIGAFTRAGALVLQGAGDVSLDLRHVTAAGSTHGIVLNASAGAGVLNPGTGSISAALADSIALSNAVSNYPGLLGIGANAATLTVARSLTAAGTDPNALFADPAGRNFRLRPGSPAIGQGAVTAGESTTDLDGEDRSAAPTDLGGDEFFNAPPVAKIVVATKTPRATQPVTFDAGTSVDREASYGGGIVQYLWTFSDGAKEATTTPTINHVFAKEGDASASLVVADRQGASSAPAAVALKLINGTPPSVGIVKPKNNEKIKRFTTKKTTKTVDGKKTTTKTRRRTKIVFRGSSADANGVAGIILTLEKLATTGSGKAKASQAASRKQCSWFNPKQGIQRKSCTSPTLITATLKKNNAAGEWSYTVKRNLSKGTYRLVAVGVDSTGAFGNAAGPKAGDVKFTLT
jgi:hypothetical protein